MKVFQIACETFRSAIMLSCVMLYKQDYGIVYP